MIAPQSKQRGLLPADGVRRLLAEKAHVQQEALGKISESLVGITVQTAMRLARSAAPTEGLSPRVRRLVRHMLRRLARPRGKADTALLLSKCLFGEQGGDHGTAQ
jgi:hypothetical protein